MFEVGDGQSWSKFMIYTQPTFAGNYKLLKYIIKYKINYDRKFQSNDIDHTPIH